MVLYDTKEKNWYFFRDVNLADDNLVGNKLWKMTLVVNAPSPLFEWQSRMTHVL